VVIKITENEDESTQRGIQNPEGARQTLNQEQPMHRGRQLGKNILHLIIHAQKRRALESIVCYAPK
jgi:hypothetical protein